MLALWAPLLSVAQTIPDPTGELRRQQEREAQERQRLQPEVDVRLPAAAPAAESPLPKGETPCFPIREVRIQVPAGLDFGNLIAATAGRAGTDSPVGQCLGAQGVQQVIKRVQDALVAKGYVTTRVGAPNQNLAEGVLSLDITPGRIHAIRLAEGSDERISLASALPLRAGDVLNIRAIEQALENFKRNPSADADIAIEPAAVEGQSDLVVKYRQAKRWRAQLSADDGGTEPTGRYQGGAVLSLDNPFRLNDQFYLSLNHNVPTSSAGEKGTRGGSLHYSVPYGWWLLGATLTQSRYHQSVAGVNQNYLYSGTTRNIEFKAARTVYRDAERKIGLHLKAIQRASHNYIEDTEVLVQRRQVGILELGTNYKQFVGQGVFEGNLAYRKGIRAFGAIPAPEEAFGEGTSRFGLIAADANLNWPFKWGAQPWRYNGLVRAQWAHTRLTPQDRFGIGGRYTVRGFDGESTLSGDRGWLIRNELSTPLQTLGAEFYAGLDHGQIAGTGSTLQVGRFLTGAVLGLRGNLKNLSYDVFVGTPVNKPALFRTARVTAGFNLTLNF